MFVCFSISVSPLTSRLLFPLSSCEQPGLGQWLKISGQQIKAMHSAHRKLQPVGEFLPTQIILIIARHHSYVQRNTLEVTVYQH